MYNYYSSILILLISIVIISGCDSTGPTGQIEEDIHTDPQLNFIQGDAAPDSGVTILNNDECSDDTRILPCNPSDQPPNPPPNDYTISVNTPSVNVSVVKDRNDEVISDINWEFQSLLAGIQTEIQYALRDVQFDDIPLGGGHENEFNPNPIFDMDLIGQFKTEVINGKINVKITLFNFDLTATIQSTKWYTSDADVEATVDEIVVKERFDVATGQFDNFQIEMNDFDVDISDGFPLGDVETVSDLIENVFGVPNFVDTEVENAIRNEVEAIYADINPNGFIAEQIDLFSDFNFAPIDGIPTQELLPIVAEGLRDFDVSAGLYVVTPDNSPSREGQLQLSINTDALNQVKSTYYANN